MSSILYELMSNLLLRVRYIKDPAEIRLRDLYIQHKVVISQ